MSARVTFQGLDELREALRALPAELAAEAGRIAATHVAAAEADIRAGYAQHRRSGKLAGRVKTATADAGRLGFSSTITNTSPLAFVFEHGSQARHTAIGANRGSMPGAHVFVPVITRERRAMYVELAAMLERHGLKVSGEA